MDVFWTKQFIVLTYHSISLQTYPVYELLHLLFSDLDRLLSNTKNVLYQLAKRTWAIPLNANLTDLNYYFNFIIERQTSLWIFYFDAVKS